MIKIIFGVLLCTSLALASSVDKQNMHSVLNESFIQSIQSLRQSAKQLKASMQSMSGKKLEMTKGLLWANHKRLTFVSTLFATLLSKKDYKQKGFDLLALVKINLEDMKKYMLEINGKWAIKNSYEARQMNEIFNLVARQNALHKAYVQSILALNKKMGPVMVKSLLRKHEEEIRLKIKAGLAMLDKKS